MANAIEDNIENIGNVDMPVALQSLRPGAQWVLRGDKYEGLEWLDEEQSQPIELDVNEEITRLTLLKEEREYRLQRSQAYAPVGQQLDMMYWDQVNGTTEWADHVADIKIQFPKPE